MNFDHVSDMVVRLKNGYQAKKSSVVITRTRQNMTILLLLARLGYIVDFKLLNFRDIEVFLSYYRNQAAIRGIQRVSRPQHRVYLRPSDLQRRASQFYTQNGFFIVSNVEGIMTDIEAMSLGLGGEVLFQVV